MGSLRLHHSVITSHPFCGTDLSISEQCFELHGEDLRYELDCTEIDSRGMIFEVQDTSLDAVPNRLNDEKEALWNGRLNNEAILKLENVVVDHRKSETLNALEAELRGTHEKPPAGSSKHHAILEIPDDVGADLKPFGPIIINGVHVVESSNFQQQPSRPHKIPRKSIPPRIPVAAYNNDMPNHHVTLPSASQTSAPAGLETFHYGHSVSEERTCREVTNHKPQASKSLWK